MKRLEFLAGSNIRDNSAEAYNKALHGQSVMFRHNGVQIIMFPDVEWIFENIVNGDSETP